MREGGRKEGEEIRKIREEWEITVKAGATTIHVDAAPHYDHTHPLVSKYAKV